MVFFKSSLESIIVVCVLDSIESELLCPAKLYLASLAKYARNIITESKTHAYHNQVNLALIDIRQLRFYSDLAHPHQMY